MTFVFNNRRQRSRAVKRALYRVAAREFVHFIREVNLILEEERKTEAAAKTATKKPAKQRRRAA